MWQKSLSPYHSAQTVLYLPTARGATIGTTNWVRRSGGTMSFNLTESLTCMRLPLKYVKRMTSGSQAP